MPKLNPALTPGTARVLRLMRDQDEELVWEGRTVWVGEEQTSAATVYRLLREVLITDISDTNGAVKRYQINDDGRKVLDDPNYETRWREVMRTGQPVHR